ncbi:MAG: hypothetical protein ACYTGR_13440 [Planctomycetota bacterium]|jgi:hypothetical protein
MTRKPTLSLVGLALATIGGIWILQSATAAPPGNTGNSRVGAWLTEAQIDGVPGLVLHQAFIFTGNGHGGTWTATDTTDFGLGGVTPGFDSPQYGVWETTNDDSTLVTTGYYFSYDEAGTHVATVRTSSTSYPNVDDPRNAFFGDWMNEVYLPGMDPMNDAPVQVATGTFTSRRITTD